MKKETIEVWGLPVRLLHLLLVVSLTAAWVMPDGGDPNWHHLAGYAAAGVLIIRLAWGAGCGPPSARITRNLRSLSRLRTYLQSGRRSLARRFLGHNPLGSAMVIALIATSVALCLTGWLYSTDRFWGYGWLAALHRGLAWLLVALVSLHVIGVLVSSLVHRENLIVAMITGSKLRRRSR